MAIIGISSHIRSIMPAALLLSALSGFAAIKVDPDPEIFDGTRTKSEEAIEQQEQPVVDDWEKGNLIIYDSEEQGEGKGGQGTVDGQGPGIEVTAGGNSMGGLPIPMMGGGGGEEGQQGGMPPPGMPQQGMPEGEVAQAAAPPPGDVEIGDPSQSIASAAQPMPTGDTTGLEDAGDDNQTSDGGSGTSKAAAGKQSGRRGAGVEKGDAIPSDL